MTWFIQKEKIRARGPQTFELQSIGPYFSFIFPQSNTRNIICKCQTFVKELFFLNLIYFSRNSKMMVFTLVVRKMDFISPFSDQTKNLSPSLCWDKLSQHEIFSPYCWSLSWLFPVPSVTGLSS